MQTTVTNTALPIGRPGEFFRGTLARSVGNILVSGTETDNAPGVVVNHLAADDDVVGVAQTGNFAGILGMPKVSVRPTLDNQTYVTNGSQVEVLQAGYVVVNLPAAANIGDWVYYLDADGTLLTAAPQATAPALSSRLPGGTVVEFNLTAAGLAVIYFDIAGSTEEPA